MALSDAGARMVVNATVCTARYPRNHQFKLATSLGSRKFGDTRPSAKAKVERWRRRCRTERYYFCRNHGRCGRTEVDPVSRRPANNHNRGPIPDHAGHLKVGKRNTLARLNARSAAKPNDMQDMAGIRWGKACLPDHVSGPIAIVPVAVCSSGHGPREQGIK
jgi:hypothetical protein